jgi:hypothetical protein
MHQAGMIATLLHDLRDDRFLADVALADMLARDPGFPSAAGDAAVWRTRSRSVEAKSE